MMAIHYYLIEALAPLVFRSAKPFGAQAYKDDATFPLPSSAAGLIRALKIEQDNIQFDGQTSLSRATLSLKQEEALKQISCTGVLLAKLNNNQKVEILIPKPSDALFVKEKKIIQDKETQILKLIRLKPKEFNEKWDCGSDLPEGLMPVQMEQEHKAKPDSGVKYWSLEHLLAWQKNNEINVEQLQKTGLQNIPVEIRTHVALNDESLVSDDGYLFQTAGLDLGYQKSGIQNQVWQDSRLAFVIGADCALESNLATFGGERRLSHFTKIDQKLFPELAEDTVQSIKKQKGFKVTLLTPSIFKNGYLPEWIDPNTLQGPLLNNEKIKVQLKAVAIERWQPVSGWDLQQWAPKAMRKAVSAGAVYWFEILSDEVDSSDIESLWFKCISDDEQDQRDGFGLTIIAPWSAN